MSNTKFLTIKYTIKDDIPKHAELIKRDTENPLTVEAIERNMNRCFYKANKRNLALYQDEELVAFIYGNIIPDGTVSANYFWFKNAKFMVIFACIYILHTDAVFWKPNYVYKSSKWYKLSNLLTGSSHKEHKHVYYITEDKKQELSDLLKRLHVTYNIMYEIE